MIDKRTISRRKILAGLGTIGAAGAIAGAGTYAYFNDEEYIENNTFTVGAIDLHVHYESIYHGMETKTDSGEIDSTQVTLFDRNLKRGDSGTTKFCFALHTNPAYLWLCGEITAGSGGKLDDAIKATLRYCHDGNPGAVIAGGEGSTLDEVLAVLDGGVPLDYDGNDVLAGQQEPYQPTSPPGGTTGPCVCIEWNIPMDVSNEIQTDRIEFEFEFHAVQARHNNGKESPCSGDGG